jgi:hypothetical protein
MKWKSSVSSMTVGSVMTDTTRSANERGTPRLSLFKARFTPTGGWSRRRSVQPAHGKGDRARSSARPPRFGGLRFSLMGGAGRSGEPHISCDRAGISTSLSETSHHPGETPREGYSSRKENRVDTSAETAGTDHGAMTTAGDSARVPHRPRASRRDPAFPRLRARDTIGRAMNGPDAWRRV